MKRAALPIAADTVPRGMVCRLTPALSRRALAAGTRRKMLKRACGAPQPGSPPVELGALRRQFAKGLRDYKGGKTEVRRKCRDDTRRGSVSSDKRDKTDSAKGIRTECTVRIVRHEAVV